MLTPLAPWEELLTRLGVDLEGADLQRAQAALDDASALIRSEAAKDWIDDQGDPEEVPDVVQSICLQVAYRAYSNPAGTTQTSVGDVSVSFSREGAAGAVFLTVAEKKAIRRAAGKSGVGTITIATPYLGNPDWLYAPVEGGGAPIPIGPIPWEYN